MEPESMRFEVKGVEQGYGKKTVIRDIDFYVDPGEVVTILGPNASGKSTLIKTMCNILAPRKGTITIDGNDIGKMDRKEFAKIVGYVPQTTTFFGHSTVYDTVLIGRKPYVEWSYSNEDIGIAAEAMIKMKVGLLYDRLVSELSGGQVQRVSLARSLAQNPRFYMFDEPTSALDLRNQLDTLKMMRSLVKETKASMVMAMHDLNLALNYSDKVLALKNGTVYKFGSTEDVITEKMIKDVYNVDCEIVDGPKGKFIYSFDEEPEADARPAAGKEAAPQDH